jgi:hypothetical protein
MGEMGVPVGLNHALASGIPTVMTSTLSRFADFLAQALPASPLGHRMLRNSALAVIIL